MEEGLRNQEENTIAIRNQSCEKRKINIKELFSSDLADDIFLQYKLTCFHSFVISIHLNSCLNH